MNVKELIEALKRAPPEARVEAWRHGDDYGTWDITVVTYDRLHRNVLMASDDREIAVSESILHNDNEIDAALSSTPAAKTED